MKKTIKKTTAKPTTTAKLLTLEMTCTELYHVDQVLDCARCGGEHFDITFRKFRSPAGQHTHFAPCPTTHEPILLQITKD